MPASRRPAVLVAAALLTTAGCGGAPTFRAAQEVGLGAHRAAGVDVSPDGRLLFAHTDAITVVLEVADDPGTVAVAAEVELPDLAGDGLAFALDDTVVVARATETAGGGSGFELAVTDATTGTRTEVRPVTPWPDRAEGWATHPLLLPDGRLVVAASYASAPPDLLVVDPRTGAVTETIPITGGVLDEVDLWSVVELAVSPDGSRLAVAVDVYDAQAGNDSIVLVLDDGFQPVGEPVRIGPSYGSGEPLGLAVTDEGAAYAAVSGALVTVPPGGDRARRVAELDAPVVDMVVAGGAAWLLYAESYRRDEEHAGVHRLALEDGATTVSDELCDPGTTPEELGRSPDGATVYAVGNCDDRATLWSFDAA